jgi:hypothetical protein
MMALAVRLKQQTIHQVTFYYTARATYDKDFAGDGMSWNKFIQWSRLTQLTELVSLDGMLNEVLVAPDRNNTEDWKHIVMDENYETGLFTTLDYVLRKVECKGRFNLLTAVIEPIQDCKSIAINEFEFIGYDLLDKDYSISALSNCGGFDETFSPHDLNKVGLIDDYNKVYDIKRNLLKNNPGEHHADTNVIAVWRHIKIGR